jgi:hypothetical protein
MHKHEGRPRARLMIGPWTVDFPDRESAMDSRQDTVWVETHEEALGFFVQFAPDGSLASDDMPYCRIIQLD